MSVIRCFLLKGGSFNVDSRLQRHFTLLTTLTPSKESICRVFGVILEKHFMTFDEEIYQLKVWYYSIYIHNYKLGCYHKLLYYCRINCLPQRLMYLRLFCPIQPSHQLLPNFIIILV